MPKQSYVIKTFHGGLNDVADPRDLGDGDLVIANGVMVDRVGKIVLAYGTTATNIVGALDPDHDILQGTGYYRWSHDFGGAAGDTVDSAGEQYICHWGVNGTYNQLRVWNAGGSEVDHTIGAGYKAVFYHIGNGLRISDSSFTQPNYALLYHPARDYGPSGGNADCTVSAGWDFTSNNVFTPPLDNAAFAVNRTATSQTLSGIDANGTFMGIARQWGCVLDFNESSQEEVGLSYNTGNDMGSWMSSGFGDEYRFYMTYLYETESESAPVQFINFPTYSDTSSSSTYVDDFGSMVFADGEHGRNFSITAVSHAGGYTSITTASPHELTDDDKVIVQGSADNNGVHDITEITTSSIFKFADTGSSTSSTYASIHKVGRNVSVYFKPIFKINGDSSANYNFASSALTSTSGGNPRVTGSRIYWGSNKDGYANIYLMFECDFTKGIRPYGIAGDLSGSSGFAPWITAPDSGMSDHMTADFQQKNAWVEPPQIETFESLNGYKHTENAYAKYKYAAVTGNQVYIGGVEQDGVYHADRMLYCPPGKYDVFPSTNILDAVTADGESITGIFAFADRILQFKQKSMYVINVSTQPEYIEASYGHMGIEYTSQVCVTDYGVAWLNESGAYLYDGQNVQHLRERHSDSGGEKVISNTLWADFVGDHPQVVYIPLNRQLVFIEDSDKTGTTLDCMIYDLTTGSWTSAPNMLGKESADNISNCIYDFDGNLVYTSGQDTDETTYNITTIPTAQQPGNFKIRTADIDFGDPSRRKKIYRVYVTYQSGGVTPNVIVKFGTDGTTTATGTFYDGDNFASNELIAATGWQIAVLKPNAFLNSRKSFALEFTASGVVPAGFEINDITIVYRDKTIK